MASPQPQDNADLSTLFQEILDNPHVAKVRPQGENISKPTDLGEKELLCSYPIAQAWHGITMDESASRPHLTLEQIKEWLKDVFRDGWDTATGTYAVPPQTSKDKGETDVQIGTWNTNLKVKGQTPTVGAEYRCLGDPAFLSITLGDPRAPVIWEVRDQSSKLSTEDCVQLDPDLDWQEAKRMCIANHDNNEKRRVDDFNRSYARELTRGLFIKFSEDGTGRKKPDITDEFRPVNVHKPSLARDVMRQAAVDYTELIEMSLQPRKRRVQVRQSATKAGIKKRSRRTPRA